MDQHKLERTFLAMECAEALGIKPLSPVLYDYAVKNSDIGQPENSLLSMGVVYSYGSTVSFIDASGNSIVMPYTGSILGELEKAGYVLCEFGKASPNFGYPMKSDGMGTSSVDMMADGYDEAVEREQQFRDKATLPSELAQRVMAHENLYGMEKFKMSGREYSYDVFSGGLQRTHQYGNDQKYEIVESLGYDNPVSRKFMSLTGHACASLSTSIPQDSDLKTFIVYASNHPILNDSIYYGPGGMYEQLSENITK